MSQDEIVKGYDRQIIKRLFLATKPYRMILFLSVFSLVAASVAEILLPVLIQQTVDQVFIGPQAANSPFDSSARLDILVKNSMLFLLLLLVMVVFNFIQNYFLNKTGQSVMMDLRLALYEKTMRQSMKFLQENPLGKIVTRLTNDLETINEFFSSVFGSLIKDFFLMVGITIALLLLDWRLGLLSIGGLPLVMLLLFFFRYWSRQAYRKLRQSVSRLNTFLAEHLAGMHIVQLFVKEDRTFAKFQQENKALLKANIGEMYVLATFRPVADLVSSLAIALTIWIGAGYYQEQWLSLGVLIAFISLVQKFFEPIMSISEKLNLMQSAMAGGERVFELLDTEEHSRNDGTLKPNKITGELRFESVTFAYKAQEPVLHELSFCLEAGKKTAIVGPSGSGKTSIAQVLCRMWEAQSGTISLDGTDIKSIELSHLRSLIQPIQQEVSLFGMSIRDNVLMGKQLSDKEVWTLLERAQAAEFVRRLAMGLDTVLSEGAFSLSGGQRQLLAFARIFAQDPPVIIMDEATSSIDSETENQIQTAMQELTKQRTSLVIAHRLSTIVDADLIIVLAAGRIVEMGSHSELMAKKASYYKLYQTQTHRSSE